MVYVGASKLEFINQRMFKTSSITFDADGEFTGFDFKDYDFLFYPKYFAMVVSRTVGATNTVAVDLQGSMNGTTFADITAQITDVTGTNPTESPVSYGPLVNGAGSDALVKPVIEIKVVVTTVGTGNTLNIFVWGWY